MDCGFRLDPAWFPSIAFREQWVDLLVFDNLDEDHLKDLPFVWQSTRSRRADQRLRDPIQKPLLLGREKDSASPDNPESEPAFLSSCAERPRLRPILGCLEFPEYLDRDQNVAINVAEQIRKADS